MNPNIRKYTYTFIFVLIIFVFIMYSFILYTKISLKNKQKEYYREELKNLKKIDYYIDNEELDFIIKNICEELSFKNCK